jgi:hypothetical protein
MAAYRQNLISDPTTSGPDMAPACSCNSITRAGGTVAASGTIEMAQ